MYGKIVIDVKKNEDGHSVSISGLLAGGDMADRAIILADLCDTLHTDPADVLRAHIVKHMMEEEADT